MSDASSCLMRRYGRRFWIQEISARIKHSESDIPQVLMMTGRKTLQTYLKTLAEDRFHVRVLLDWRGNEQYSETVDGVLVDIGEDYLALDREISDFEKEKYGTYDVQVIIPLTRVVQVISFFSATK